MPIASFSVRESGDSARSAGGLTKKAQARRGPPLISERNRRVAYAIRLPRYLVAAFRDVCEERGEQTKVVESAIRRYVAKHGGG